MSQRVLIIGAGLTGLALAAGLRARGVDPVVVEQAPIITEAGWAIALSERHLSALDRIGLTDRSDWPGYRAKQNLFFNGTTGLVEHVTSDGSGPLAFSRSELQLAFLQPVKDLVRAGVQPSSVTDHGDTVEVTFDDGRHERFDAVIGADGINSWTRRHVLDGPDATYAGCATVRFQAPNTDNLTMTGGVDGDQAVLAYLLMDGGRRLHGVVFLPGEPDNRRELSLPELADLFPHATGPMRSLINEMRHDPPSYYANIQQAVVPTWARNRVAIMGDAAHAMSPVLAQGAGVGLEDAALLADLLAMPHLPIPLALASYQNIRKPPAQEIQTKSYQVTQALGSVRPGEMGDTLAGRDQ
ncbi:MAG: FAD-dependent monooxygenase [Kutzneria sp.]|nr:FAD-dependent monooxygenase [Kutzneria sp.]